MSLTQARARGSNRGRRVTIAFGDRVRGSRYSDCLATESSGEPFFVFPVPPARAKPVRAVRSTLVTSGLGVLQARGLFDRYLAALEARHRDAAKGVVAASWLPADFMHAHYAAWDTLGLSAAEVRAIGKTIASGVRDTLQLAVKHLASGIGATPWTAMAQYGRLWSRSFDGGGVRIERLGPKEASLAFSELPFAGSPYFRGSLVAIHEDALGLLATKMYARIVPKSVAPAGFELRLSWV